MHKAKADFDRIDLAMRPKIPEAEACSQSQAAALSVAGPGEKSVLHVHK